MPYLTGVVFLAVIALASYFGFFKSEPTAPQITSTTNEIKIVEKTTPPATINSNPTPTTPAVVPVASHSVVTVTYANGTFTPKALEVKQGDTVNFVNQTGDRMWVASDPHPSHTVFPEFDQKTSGNNYSFVFTKKGAWNFHNHLNTSARGVVTVK